MAGIFHPTRGGNRGGQDQFNWEDVKTDKDREYYLGHSVKASVGKWQEGKDLMWYTRDKNKDGEVEKRKKEIESVKDVEARAMAAALGHKSHSSAATSLTAKELQEVLSRDQSGPSDRGEASQLKKQMESAQIKEAADVKLRRSKKRKKEKRKKKKKKKKKKKDESDDSSSDEEVEKSKMVQDAHSSKQRSESFTTREKRLDNNAFLRRNKRKSSESECSGDDRRGRREYNNMRMKVERRDNDRCRYNEEKYTGKKRKIPVGPKYRNCDTSEDDTSQSDGDKVHRNSSKSAKNKHNLVKPSRYSSENDGSGSNDKPVSRHNNSSKNDRTYNQPADSHVQFTPRNKRPRHDTESS